MEVNRGLRTERFSKLKTRKGFWIVAALAILLAAGAGLWIQKTSTTTSTATQYEQATVKRDSIVVGLDSDGNIEFSKVNLRFGASGVIAEVLVSEGDEVKKGDVIARLDDQDYQDQYQLALAKLKDAQEQKISSNLESELKLQNTKLELQKLNDEYQEMEAIPDAYSASEIKSKKMELDNKKLEYANMKKKYDLEKDKPLKQEEFAVEMARKNLEDTILYAPVSGVILNIANKVGESVTSEVDFATIHENNAVKASTKVIEYDISQIKVGQKAYVTVEATPDQKYTGEVSSIDALPAEDSSGLVNYSVVVDIKDPVPELKDGMTCTVSFVTKEVSDCLIVPYNAIKIVNGKQVVTVVGKNGQQTERQVKAGFTDGTSVEVLEGLQMGETVVYPKK